MAYSATAICLVKYLVKEHQRQGTYMSLDEVTYWLSEALVESCAKGEASIRWVHIKVQHRAFPPHSSLSLRVIVLCPCPYLCFLDDIRLIRYLEYLTSWAPEVASEIAERVRVKAVETGVDCSKVISLLISSVNADPQSWRGLGEDLEREEAERALELGQDDDDDVVLEVEEGEVVGKENGQAADIWLGTAEISSTSSSATIPPAAAAAINSAS